MKEKTIRELPYKHTNRFVCKHSCDCEECAIRIKCLKKCPPEIARKLLKKNKLHEYVDIMEVSDLWDYLLSPKLTKKEASVVVHNIAVLYLLKSEE